MTTLADRLRLTQLPLEAALAAVRVAIEQRRDGRDTLAVATTTVRQLGGVMRVIDCAGGWLLLDEAAQLLHALGASAGPAGPPEPPEPPEPALQALSAATIEIGRYLEYLRDGGADQVLLLREAINALRRGRGAPELGLLDLAAGVLASAPAASLSLALPATDPDDDPDDQPAALARSCMAPFQAAFLRWFRDPADDAARTELADLASRLGAACKRSPALRDSLLAIAGALADRLEPQTEAEARRLVGRAVMWVRALAAADPSGVVSGGQSSPDPGEDRLRLLALLALQADTPARRALLAGHELRARLLPLPSLAAAAKQLRRPDALTRRRFAEEVARELAGAREAIDLAVRTGADDAGEDVARRLERLAPLFEFADRAQAAQLLRDSAARARQPGSLGAEAADLATGLLALEYEPEGASGLAQVGPRGFSLAEARVALAGAALRDLARLRQAFELVAEPAPESAPVPARAPSAAQAAAWMQAVCVAGHWLGDDALQAELRQWSAQWSAAWPGGALALDQRLRLAETLAAVELWFEALERPCAVVEAPRVLLQRSLAASGAAADTGHPPVRHAPAAEPLFAGDDAELRASSSPRRASGGHVCGRRWNAGGASPRTWRRRPSCAADSTP
jgi:hypothetical protein